MEQRPPGRWARSMCRSMLGCLLGTVALGATTGVHAQQDQRIEEVIVTGTFIRRDDHFDTASPIEVIDATDIAESGTPNIGEILRNTTYNYGVSSVNNILAASPQDAGSVSSNLRGLGTGSTLTIMDGRRSTSQNIAVMYPQVAIERMETLTDGGAALYGTDAVGGVLNLIPRRQYEGLEVRLTHNATGEGDWEESTWSVLGGAQMGDTSLVGAFEYRDRGELQFMDREEFALGAPSYSTTANPGTWSVPVRDAEGNVVTQATQNDPGCGFNNPEDATKQEVGGFRQGRLDAIGTCIMEFGANFNFMSESESWVGAFFLDHRFTDHLTFQSELVFARQISNDRGSPQNPGGRMDALPTIPGEHPGNPFRAMNADGVPLYAEPADPDDPQDFQPARDDEGNVVLAADPTDPTAGVAFNEDVQPSSWRPLGFPFNPPSRNLSDGAGIGDAHWRSNKYRWVGQLDFLIPDTSWSGWLSYTFDQVNVESQVRRESLSGLSAGLTGDLTFVSDPDTDTVERGWYNPFSTQNFACQNRQCFGGQVQDDPAASNPTTLLDQIFKIDKDTTETTFNIVDFVATGDLFELPAGPVGAAFGGQWRGIRYEEDDGNIANAFDSFIGFGNQDWSERRSVFATFGEINLPIFDTMELGMVDINAAVRLEWVDDDADADLDSDDYKISARWELRDWVALRASWSTAFNTPSLTELFSPFSLGLSNVGDPFTGTDAFISRTTAGNPDLEPQTANVWNAGFTLDFLEGDLTYAFDWKVFDFEDRIVRLIPEDVLRDELQRYVAEGFPTDATGVPTEQGLQDWMESGLADPGIERTETGALLTVDTPLVNASTIDWRGLDTRLSYRFDGSDLPFIDAEIGRFSTTLMATYVHSYAFVAGPGDPEVEGAGNRNNATAFVPPTPRWRANLRLGWDRGIHTVVIHGRYTHSVVNDGEPFAALVPAAESLAASPFVPTVQTPEDFLESRGVTNPHRENIPSHTEWDVQYRVNLDGLWGPRRTELQLGLINAFDKKPPRLMTLGGLETFMHDPRRRIWYVRATQEI